MVVPMPTILPGRCRWSASNPPADAVRPKLFYLPTPIPSLNITPPTCSPCSTAVGPAYGSTHADDTLLANADGPLPIPQLIQSVRSCSTYPRHTPSEYYSPNLLSLFNRCTSGIW